ncbi:MAG: Response regulator SaeR [Candidatus Heimdallarchaeota archaeon LC_3]|nr:MAG: Response regulator SaeR [Candidatus Heimdallarchaeota archaeon LC_3]
MVSKFVIVHIDDQEMFLDVTKSFLSNKDENLEFINFENPEKAVDFLMDNKIDLIISDYQMPELSGLDVLKKIRESNIHTPFIFLTGKGREEVVIEALNLGADYYIQKGIDFNITMTELMNHVNKERKKKLEQIKREKAEKSLHESQEQLSFIVDNLLEEIGLLRNEGNDKFKVVAVNKAFLENTGFLKEEVIGKVIEEFLPKEQAESVLQGFKIAIESRKPNKKLTGEPGNYFQSYDIPIFNSQNEKRCDYILRVGVKL